MLLSNVTLLSMFPGVFVMNGMGHWFSFTNNCMDYSVFVRTGEYLTKNKFVRILVCTFVLKGVMN